MQRPRYRGEPAGWHTSMRLFLAKVDGFVLVAGDAGANLRGRPAGLGFVIGVKAFSSTDVALGGVRVLIATVQAGVAEGAIAAAIARKLVDDGGNLGGQQIGRASCRERV